MQTDKRCGTCKHVRQVNEHYSICAWSIGRTVPFWATELRWLNNNAGRPEAEKFGTGCLTWEPTDAA